MSLNNILESKIAECILSKNHNCLLPMKERNIFIHFFFKHLLFSSPFCKLPPPLSFSLSFSSFSTDFVYQFPSLTPSFRVVLLSPSLLLLILFSLPDSSLHHSEIGYGITSSVFTNSPTSVLSSFFALANSFSRSLSTRVNSTHSLRADNNNNNVGRRTLIESNIFQTRFNSSYVLKKKEKRNKKKSLQ